MSIGIYQHKSQQGFQKGNKLGLGKHYNLGIKRSAEFKRKVSNALKGRIPKNLSAINANKKGVGNPMYGKKWSEAKKESHSKQMKKWWGNHPEKKEEIRKRFLGKNNPKWKGGITPINNKIRGSLEYKLWQDSVLSKDGYLCKKCNENRIRKLMAHHIRNFAQYLELRFAIDNGTTFCRKCHQEFHKKYGKRNNNLKQIIEYLKRSNY